MALIQEVKTICDRLALHGWQDLLLQHGLDITAEDLEQELSKTLANINRTIKGFEDFSRDGVRGIEPGSPARSLLYHAFASPAVHPTPDGQPSADPEAYPTLEELDIVENYIYSLANRKLSDFPNAVIVVFAYQYRTGDRSPHRVHADMAFSRTGVARVGTTGSNYNPVRRSFSVEPEDGSENIAVMPARYGAFLAIARTPSSSDAVLEAVSGDNNRTFLFPVHKLFPGSECFIDANITLEFLEYHRNEKLRRIHTHGNVPVLSGFDVNKAPFVRDSRNSNDLVTLETVGSSVLLVPQAHPELVRTATQRNSRTGRNEIVRFKVPAVNQTNRFWTSYQISPTANGRQAPEYVNIRHLVQTNSAGVQELKDLNQEILNENDFIQKINLGGYEAAHFIDDSCDGCVTVKVNGLLQNLANYPAYSLVTAPDFLPLADQIEIQRWVNNALTSLQDQFRQGGPSPLSAGRRTANPNLDRPDRANTKAFDRTKNFAITISAVVGSAPLSRSGSFAPHRTPVSTSFLPDAASNVFAPGWDISLGADSQGSFYAAYGLGSPFPEDAKLCAALNSFWPAAAPDTSRTFGIQSSPTAIPMLDTELGYHPQHPRVKSGEVPSRQGWDGEYGPFFEKVNQVLHVNYANKDRSDYSGNALVGQIRVAELEEVNSDELISRMEALRFCIRTLPPSSDKVSTSRLWLVTAEKVNDWASRRDRGNSMLKGSGYLYVFALVQGSELLTNDFRRKRFQVSNQFTCQVTKDALCWKQDQGAFQFVKASLR